MNPQEQRALLAVALMAALADGQKTEAEHDEVQRIVGTLGPDAAALDVPGLMQDILSKRLDLTAALAPLQTLANKQLAYELAQCVCHADGAHSPSEKQFLATLKAALGDGIDTGIEAQIAALAQLTDSPAATAIAAAAGTRTGAAIATPGASVPSVPSVVVVAVDTAALQASIQSQAILCGALELLPQSWASMAIIPLQVKLVYRIGQAHGAQLDASMVKEFIATAGVGLTGQYLEQFGRKLVGGLLGSLLGGLGRGVGGLGTSMAMSFATTYALGQLALRYYGGGRQMNTDLLRQTYQDLLGSARQLQTLSLPQIEERARTLNAGQVLDLVRRPLA